MCVYKYAYLSAETPVDHVGLLCQHLPKGTRHAAHAHDAHTDHLRKLDRRGQAEAGSKCWELTSRLLWVMCWELHP